MKNVLVWLLGILALWASVANAAETDGEQFARHAPRDTSFAVFSRNVAETCAAFQKTELGKVLGGAEFAKTIDELGRLNRASALHLRPAFGFDWGDLAKVADPVGLMIFPLEKSSQGMVGLFTAKASTGNVLPPCLDIAKRYFLAQGFKETTFVQAGVAMSVFQPPAARNRESTRVVFVADRFYGVANSQAAVAAVLRVTPERSLAAETIFKDSLAAASAGTEALGGEAYFFLRPMEHWNLVQASNPEPDSERVDRLSAARRLGMEAVQAVAGRIEFAAPAPFAWELQAKVIVRRPLEKALRLLDVEPGPFSPPPAWIDAEISAVSSWRWNFPQAMKGFANLFDETNEPGPDGEGLFDDLLDGLRDDPEGVRVDLRNELFALLGPEVVRVDDNRGSPTDSNSDVRRWLYSVAVRKAEKVVDTLTRFYQGDKRVTHRLSAGYEVWTVGEGASLFVEGESDSLVSVRALAVGNGQLLFSMDPKMLDDALTGRLPGPRLIADLRWAPLVEALMKWEGPQTAARSLLRLDQILEPDYPATAPKNESEATNPMRGMWQLLLLGRSEESKDASVPALPGFEVLRGALPAAGMSLSQADDGWMIRLGALRGGASE